MSVPPYTVGSPLRERKANTMTYAPVEALLGTITSESDALDTIIAIRDRFGFTGTVFTPSEVEGMASDVLSEQGNDFADAFYASVAQTVIGEYEFRKLGDMLSERGNITLGDAVASYAEALEDGNGYEFDALLLVDRDSDDPQSEALERRGFSTSQAAFQWARQYVGSPASVCIPLTEADRLLNEPALGLPVIEVGLVVRGVDGRHIARYVSNLS